MVEYLYLGIVGTVITYIGFNIARKILILYIKETRGSKNWPSVEGTILFSEVSARRNSDGTSYFPVISYEYVINGKIYKGERLGLSETGMNSQ